MTEVIVKLHALRRKTRWRPKTDSFIQYKHTSYAGYVLWINIFVPSLEAASSFLNASQKNFIILSLLISFCSHFCIVPKACGDFK